MSQTVRTLPQSRFRIGWILLLVTTALMTLNHGLLMFVLDEPVLFAGFTVFNLYALVVLVIPFRERNRWAWYTTWLLPAGLAIPASGDPQIAAIYYVVAALMVAGLLLTLRDFFGDGVHSQP